MNGKHKILPFVNCYVCGKQMHTDSFQHHIRSRKHQKLLHEAQDLAKFWIKVIGNSSVFFKEDIIRSIFEKHGKILRIAFQNNAFFIRFLKVKSVVHALDRQHYKNDFNLNIRVMPLYIQPQHPMEVDVFQVEPENNESDDFRRILSTTIESIQHRTISQLVTFDSIANEIVLSVLSRADNESGSGQVYAELQRMFSAWCASVLRDHGISVKVHVYVFGSIEIGLSLSRYSDIDVYVDVGSSYLDMLHETTRLLYQNSDKFHDILSIKGARVPIVKAVHTLTDIPIDISFKSKLGWYNTQLIKFYVKYDTRVKTLLALIKIWFKRMELNDTRAFTSYSIYWLALFYLQQLSPPLIPNVHQLLQFYPSTQCLRWKVVHSEEMQLQRHEYPASPNTMSIEKLLLGFFKYYSSAELRDMVICPLLGKLLPRRVFEPDHLDELPQELDAYRRYALEFPKDSLKISSSLCIQDPYDLSHNITKAVNHSTLSLLQHNIEIIWILQRHSPARLLLACLEDHNAERDTQLENYAKQNETMRLQRLLAACEEKKKAREKNALADKAQGNASSLKKQETRERGHATGNTKEKDTDSRKPPDTRDRAPATGQTESPRDTPETRRASRPLPEDPNATRGTGRKSPDGAVSRKTLIITNSKLGSTALRKTRHRDASSSQSREESGSEDRNSKPGGRENRPGNDRVGRKPNGESKDLAAFRVSPANEHCNTLNKTDGEIPVITCGVVTGTPCTDDTRSESDRKARKRHSDRYPQPQEKKKSTTKPSTTSVYKELHVLDKRSCTERIRQENCQTSSDTQSTEPVTRSFNHHAQPQGATDRPVNTSSDSVQNPSSRSTNVQKPFSGSVNVQNPSNSPPVQNPTSLNVQNTSTSCNNVQNTTSESTNESSDFNSNPLLAMFSNIALSCPGSQAPSSDKPSNDPPTSRLSNGPITSPPGMQSFAAMFPASSVAPMAAFPVNRLPFPGMVTPVFPGPAGVFPGMVAFPEHRMPFVSTPAGMFPGTATIPGTTSAPLFPVASSNVFPGSPVSSSPQSSTSSSSSVMETLKLLAYHSPQSRIQTDLRSKDVTDIENQLLGTVQQSESNQTNSSSSNRLHHSHSISNSINSNESRNQAKLPASHSCDLSSSSNQAINSGNVSTRSVSSSGNTSLPDIEAQLQRLKLMMGGSGRQQSGSIVPLPRPNPGDTSRVNFIDVSDLENTLRLSRDVSENGTSSSDPDSSTKKSWDSRSTSSASGHSKPSATQRGVHASNTSSQPGHSLSSAGSNSRISTGEPKDRPSHVKHKPNRTQDTSDSHRNRSHDITNRDNPRIRDDPRTSSNNPRTTDDPRNRDNPRTKDNPRIRDDPRTSSETPRNNSTSLKNSSGKPSNSKPVTLPVKQEQDIHRNDNSVHKKRSESHRGTLNGEQNSATKQLPLAAKQIPPTSKEIPPSKQLPPFTKQRSPVNRNVSTTKHPSVSNQPSSVPAHVSTSPPMLNGPSPSHPHPKDQTYRIQTRTVDNKRSVIIVIYPPAGTHPRDRAFFDIVNSVLTDYLTKVCRVEIHCKRYVNAWEFLLQGTHKLDVCQKRNKLLKEVGFSPPRSLNHSKFQVEILKTNFLLMNARESLSENQFVVSLSCLGATGSGETQVILKNENGKQETSQYLSFLAFLQNAFDVIYKEMMQRCHQINR